MDYIIKRVTDNKYLISPEANTWTENIEEANRFSKPKAEIVKIQLYSKTKILNFVILPVEEPNPEN